MTLNEWMDTEFLYDGPLQNRNRVQCADGFSMSVQAGVAWASKPSFRTDNASGYTHFEIGFPSAWEPILTEFAEDPDAPTETIYIEVPRDVAEAVIANHGGIRCAARLQDDLTGGASTLRCCHCDHWLPAEAFRAEVERAERETGLTALTPRVRYPRCAWDTPLMPYTDCRPPSA